MTRTVEHTDVFDALPELKANSGHAALVDYPWEFDAQNGTGRMSDDRQVTSLDYDVTDHDRLADVLNELSRVLVTGAWVFVCADDVVLPEFRRIVESSSLT